MRIRTIIMQISAIIFFGSFTLFGQNNKEINSKSKKEMEADSVEIVEFHKFKKEALARIKENRVKIEKLESKEEDNQKKTSNEYDQKILELENKNNELETRIKGYDSKKMSEWESFKMKFAEDLNVLEDYMTRMTNGSKKMKE